MTTMLRYLLALLVLLFGAAEAHAQIVTWEFAGQITRIQDPRGCLTGLTLGDPFRVAVTLDRNSPGAPSAQPGGFTYDLTAGAQYRIDVILGLHTFTSQGATDPFGQAPQGRLFLVDSDVANTLGISADLRHTLGAPSQRLTLDYNRSGGGALNGVAIPDAPFPLELTTFTQISLRFNECGYDVIASPIQSAGAVHTVDVCEGLHALMGRVAAAALPKGTTTSLVAKLSSAEHALCDAEPGNDAKAAGVLGAFQHELRAQSGKKVGALLADSLSDDAQAILDAITD